MRRRLFVWMEDHVLECSVVLKDYFLVVDVSDTWLRHLDPGEGHTVKGVYH